MYKINLIIPSLNRAAQCDLLLRSIEHNAPDLFDVAVLWKATTPEFEMGYLKLIDNHLDDRLYKIKHKSKISFIEQGVDFRNDMVDLLLDANFDFVATMMDDDILYRPLNFSYNDVKELLSQATMGTLSLRLGLNTDIQTYHQNNTIKLPMYDMYNQFIYWQHKQYGIGENWRYYYSLDGNIFRKDDLAEKLDFKFDNPNSLEAGLMSRGTPSDRFMVCTLESKLTSLCVNAVSTWGNTAGVYHPQSAQIMNDKFLSGLKIDLGAAIELCYPSRCTHHEIEFQWQ